MSPQKEYEAEEKAQCLARAQDFIEAFSEHTMVNGGMVEVAPGYRALSFSNSLSIAFKYIESIARHNTNGYPERGFRQAVRDAQEQLAMYIEANAGRENLGAKLAVDLMQDIDRACGMLEDAPTISVIDNLSYEDMQRNDALMRGYLDNGFLQRMADAQYLNPDETVVSSMHYLMDKIAECAEARLQQLDLQGGASFKNMQLPNRRLTAAAISQGMSDVFADIEELHSMHKGDPCVDYADTLANTVRMSAKKAPENLVSEREVEQAIIVPTGRSGGV